MLGLRKRELNAAFEKHDSLYHVKSLIITEIVKMWRERQIFWLTMKTVLL